MHKNSTIFRKIATIHSKKADHHQDNFLIDGQLNGSLGVH